ncbi:MAG: ribonuclease HII [Parcubacteria group bacterium GW2011_GWA2_47_10]|nr:MAG: ribonuclease HII [Parcubacteria group bacterium GW2011_GWA2_47_10]
MLTVYYYSVEIVQEAMEKGQKTIVSRKKSRQWYVIGIDEAGRGPLAGPVVVAGICVQNAGGAVSAHRAFSALEFDSFFNGIRDSKKISEKKREEWYRKITKNPAIQWAVAVVDHDVIDRINILQATNRGVHDVYKKLSFSASVPALLDGGLSLPKPAPFQAIIKGDEKIPLISAASIIAKVTRDRIMRKLHKKYPRYRFDLHKGYGTKLHRKLIKRFGRSQVHRRSFQIS